MLIGISGIENHPAEWLNMPIWFFIIVIICLILLFKPSKKK